jgi:hypothetical protein
MRAFAAAKPQSNRYGTTKQANQVILHGLLNLPSSANTANFAAHQ